MLIRVIDFFRYRIWRTRYSDLEPHQRYILRPLRVITLAIRGFLEDAVGMRASALTVYTLLSVVPVLAVAFGIAKGFGLQEYLERTLKENLQGQEAVLEPTIRIANDLLGETRGGLVAGVGVVFLIWAVMRLLGSIESSLNHIWGIKEGRRLGRRVIDYLVVIFITPLLIAISGLVIARMAGLNEELPFLQRFDVAARLVSGFLPFLLVMLVFTLMYLFIPNIKVSFRAAFLSSFLATVLYHIIQRAYFESQAVLAGYSAVYGTFAALPLFLIWVQLSWIAVLFGAEMSFAIDNEDTYALEHDCASVSHRFRQLLALRFVQLAGKRFAEGKEPIRATELSHDLEIPVRLVRTVLHDLVVADVLSQVGQRREGSEAFQPARTLDSLTIKSVLDALDKTGNDETMGVHDRGVDRLARTLNKFDSMVAKSPENVPLHTLHSPLA